MKEKLEAYFALKKPCENCPFRKQGAIDLRPGRLEGIIESLLKDDWETFQCHKTVHNPRTGGEWVDDDGEHRYIPSGREAMCAGAIIYLEKVRSPSVPMRLGHITGLYRPEEYMKSADCVIDPIQKKERKKRAK
jgi:hypothetical protein